MSESSRDNLQDTRVESDSTLKKREYNRLRYAKNKKLYQELAKEYRKKPEIKIRISAYKKQYHLKNRKRLIEKSRAYYDANREKKLAYGKEWRKNNRDRHKIYSKIYRLKLRDAAFEHYGGPICNCCRENIVGFLTIDHINGDGNIHRNAIKTRGGHGFYQWLKNNNYPLGFQVLCYNCNMAKGVYGVCPHGTKDQIPPNTIIPL